MSGFWQIAKRFVESALDYSRDLVIGNGVQGPFDHFLAFKNTNQSSCRQDRFNPNDLFLYAVTDSGMNRKWGRSIAEAVKAAVEGGATIVQLRFVTFLFFYIDNCDAHSMFLAINIVFMV
jgi:hydroxymethylpyrimidine kinase/phosphomethylpyrimidine kinase/thiamine-phosphate diphosphorylase